MIIPHISILAVKISHILEKTEYPVGITIVVFVLFVPMLAYMLVGANYMAHKTIAFH